MSVNDDHNGIMITLQRKAYTFMSKWYHEERLNPGNIDSDVYILDIHVKEL